MAVISQLMPGTYEYCDNLLEWPESEFCSIKFIGPVARWNNEYVTGISSHSSGGTRPHIPWYPEHKNPLRTYVHGYRQKTLLALLCDRGSVSSTGVSFRSV